MRYRMLLVIGFLLLATPRLQAQGLPDNVLEAAITRVAQLSPGLGRPTRWEFSLPLPTTDSALGCPQVPGVQTNDTKQPYIVTLFYGETDAYNVHVSGDLSRVVACDTDLPGASGMQPVDTSVRAATACTVAPSGPFANVRIAPETEAEQLGTIEASFPALGRNAEGTWFLTEVGWVAATVVTQSGQCIEMPVRDNTIALNLTPQALPSGTPPPGATAIPPTPAAGPTPIEAICPTDLEGYLPPRIQAGFVTAQIEQGGLPNTLRQGPSVDAAQVGTVQPGRRIDRVITGPRCSSGFVWWQIEVDGVIGWTAESDAASGEYFIRPTTGNAATPAVEVAAVPGAAAGINLDTLGTLAVAETFDSVDGFTWSADGTLLAISRPGEVTIVRDTVETMIAIPEGGVVEVAFSDDNALIAAAISDGRVLLGSAADSYAFTTTLFNESGLQINALAFRPGSTELAAVRGDQLATEGRNLYIWDTETGELLRNVRYPYAMLDVAYSADGSYLAVVGEDVPQEAAALWIYDADTDEQLTSTALASMRGEAVITAVPPVTGSQFAFSNGPAVDLYNVDSDETLAPISVGSGTITGLDVFDAGSAVLIAVAESGEVAEQVSFYNLNQVGGQTITPLSILSEAARAVSFNPDGTGVGVLGTDATLRIYR